MKNQKIKAFYTVASGAKPNQLLRRHYIHSSESLGLWAEIRDLSQKEVLANEAVGKQIGVYITVGYNPALLERWAELTLIDERGTSYRIKAKPDEFDYAKRDIRIAAYAYEDTAVYSGSDVYD